MALSYPYSVNFLANCLTGERIPLQLQRNDELSGSGDGRYWAAQLSRPLWSASYSLYAKSAAHAREINAKIYGLDGSTGTFLWCDPYYEGPAAGDYAGVDSIEIASLSSDRTRITFTNMPAGFEFTAGDYISVAYGTDRYYFATLCEGGGSGGAPREVRPAVPLGVSVGDTVTVSKPVFKAIIPPNGFTPFASFRGRWGDSASITVLQKP